MVLGSNDSLFDRHPCSDIWEELAASIFCVGILPWLPEQQVCPKRWYKSVKPFIVTLSSNLLCAVQDLQVSCKSCILCALKFIGCEQRRGLTVTIQCTRACKMAAFIYSLCSLSRGRPVVSSKVSSPQIVILCILFQIRDPEYHYLILCLSCICLFFLGRDSPGIK